ncbi:MAG: FAD-dependent thymidylate synthase [Rickettsiales bacterium]|nr:FAD-dependent thymidylate synthase [Rickettsiales bacterium]
MKVSLISKSTTSANELTSHAAKTCYSADVPKLGISMDVENHLFKTGHHTTFQHNYYTFNIDGISVNDTIFGLHLTHPFYNTDQRSGRFSKMYVKPDYDELKEKIAKYYPNSPIDEVIEFIKQGRKIYKNNMEKATELATSLIKEERPFANAEYIETNANKIAQEQMRMFISTIMPTALDYTLNLSAISAMYRASWNPEMRDVFEQIKKIVLKEEPNLEYIFKNQRQDNWTPDFISHCGILTKPQLHKMDTIFSNVNYDFNAKEKDSVDLKQFTPEFMNNNFFVIQSEIEVSLATFAQDQRHRTLKRGIPTITGNFYLPPIPAMLGLEKEALEYMQSYDKLWKKLDKTLALMIAPYGVMVKYSKKGDANAIIHEQEKRLCWSAQEEIYNLCREFYLKLHNSEKEQIKTLTKLLLPACHKSGCIEGRRYCGRDIKKCKGNDVVVERKI